MQQKGSKSNEDSVLLLATQIWLNAVLAVGITYVAVNLVGVKIDMTLVAWIFLLNFLAVALIHEVQLKARSHSSGIGKVSISKDNQKEK
jgi:uncharacterized paraquat-inducible protein A